MKAITKNYGHCAICGKYGKLTFEHIPPKKAWNSTKANVYSLGEQLKRSEGKPSKHEIQQQGMGRYSLCKDCNNNTGSWYAQAYIDFVHIFTYCLLNSESLEHGDALKFTTPKVQPLAFVKQIISFFCSAMPYEKVKELGFDALLLDRESSNVGKDKFDLRMFISSISTPPYSSGVAACVYVDKKTHENSVINVAEMSFYPFGFILNFDTDKTIPYGVSLMEFFNTKYEDDYKIDWIVPYLEKHSTKLPLPLQFKTMPVGAIEGEVILSKNNL